jgi:hypothetical protein
MFMLTKCSLCLFYHDPLQKRTEKYSLFPLRFTVVEKNLVSVPLFLWCSEMP